MKEDHKDNEEQENLDNSLPEQTIDQSGEEVSESWLYQLFVKSAYRLLEKPLAVFQILKKAVKRISKYQSIKDFTEDAQERLSTIIRLVRAYSRGEYREISRVNIALTLAAIIYFIAPFDLIPDFLGIGLLDDLAILTWVYENFRSEIEDFLEWEDEQKVRIELNENGEAAE